MEFQMNLTCSVYEVAQQTTDEKTKAQLLNLWKNLAHYKRATEAIRIAAPLHSDETINESRKELNKFSKAENLFSSIILD